MKIAHILSHYPDESGPGRMIRGLARACVRLGHHVEVWSSLQTHDTKPELVRTFRKPLLSRLVPPPGLLNFIRSQGAGYDLVVLHGMFSPSHILLAHCLKQAAVPYIVCPHNPYHPLLLRKHYGRKACYRRLERYVLNHSLAVHVFHSHQVRHLRAFGCHTQAIVLENGFEPDDVPEPAHRTLHANSPVQEIRVLFLGRLDQWQKGLDLMLHAFARLLVQEFSSALRLIFIGPDQGDLSSLQRLAAKRGIADRVDFLKPDYTRHPVEIIRNYTLFMAPSRYDGFPFTVLEAMLAETPVIVSSEAGIHEHVQNAQCGVITAPQTDAIAAALRHILQRRDEWREMGKRGRTYAFEHLTWNHIARKAIRMYEALLTREK